MPRTRLANFLILFSAAAFVVGLVFLATAKLYDAHLGYGIVFISIPAWTLGAIAGGGAALMVAAPDETSLSVRRRAAALLVLNVAAVALVFVIPFHAS